MTDLTTTQPASADVTTPAPQAPAAAEAGSAQAQLRSWALAMSDAGNLARVLCASSFAPAHLRGNTTDAGVAIMKGASLGLDPIAAMESIYVISGKPTLYARTMLAVVQQAGHDVWVDDQSDTSVTVSGRRRGSQQVQSSTWTIDRARTAGYLSNKKYSQEPQAMLRAKATAEVCRMIAADALMGLSYSAEEVELDGLGDDQPTVKVSRKRKPKTEPEPVEVPAAVIDDLPAAAES